MSWSRCFPQTDPPIQILGCNQITEADEHHEYRMSNKEFRMMKFNDFDPLLRHSLFVIRPARYALKKL
jgi:hypothetical protein